MTEDTQDHDSPEQRPESAKTNGHGPHSVKDLEVQVAMAAVSEGDAAASEADEGASEAAAPAPTKENETPSLLARGNPLRWKRGGVVAAVGAVLVFLLMAHNGQTRVSIPVGLLLVMVVAWGVMDLLGTFDDKDAPAGEVTLSAMYAPLLRLGLSFGIFSASIAGAASGAGIQWGWGIIVTLTFLVFIASIFKVGWALGPWKTDEAGEERPLTQRHGFWLIALGACLYFPTLGIFSLWDPWETHYGEVAREILARDDWISLWWAQDGWFWSKPILNFWIQALAMSPLGVKYQPDMMLQGVGGASAHPEWVVRTPNVLLTILAMYLLYKGVAKVFGRRAGLLGGIALATMPDWFFLAHQTMTDMPFVAAMTSAMGLMLLGLNTSETARASVYTVTVGTRRFGVSMWHIVMGTILVAAIPQIIYLATRNLELVVHGSGPHGFRFHWDEFRSGSAGNCGLPGNENCSLVSPASVPRALGARPEGFGPMVARTFGAFEPFLQAIVWSVVLGVILYLNWGERRLQRLYYLAAWFFAAIATMAKGPAGFAVPIVCAFAYVCTKKRWSELTRLEILSGALVILAVALPWYVAMYVRHGSPFTDRLIFHDMFNRAFGHVHDTNEGDDTSFRFYLWQLGYAVFPWSGLGPLGLMYWARRSDTADRGKGDASVFLVMWFLFTFALFSFMGTKFHHYIFPAVPPMAMLIGVVLDDMMGRRAVLEKGGWPLFLAGTGSGLALIVVGVSRFFPGTIMGFKGGSPSVPLGAGMAIAGLAVCILAARSFFARDASSGAPATSGGIAQLEPEADQDTPRARHEQLMVGGALVAGALGLVLVARDLAIKTEGADQPGPIRLLQLFTYNYRRPWPDTLDFGGAMFAFGGVAVVLSLVMVVRKWRPLSTAAFATFAVVWALWGLDVYMMKTSPHWGQHEVIEAYYRARRGAQEPLVAYQMNWKGENFYTSNRIPAFVSSGAPFATWLRKEKDKGTGVVFFVTEHSRISGLRSEVGAKALREVTDKALCNKFVLVRAEL